MKSQFFLALLALFAFITISTSVPVPSNPPPKSGTIQVTAPTKGPWARYSYQSVSWNANVAVPNQWQQTVHVYIYQVVSGAADKLIEQLPDKSYGNTWDGFQITDKYPLDGKFYALVVLASDATVYGTSDVFTIFSTGEKPPATTTTSASATTSSASATTSSASNTTSSVPTTTSSASNTTSSVPTTTSSAPTTTSSASTATSSASTPTGVPPNPAPKSGQIQVTAPTKGPWAIGSYQSVSWNANVAVPNQWQQTVHVYIYQVVSAAPDKLIATLPDEPYGNTWDGFQITNQYTKDGKYYALVVLASNPSIYGTSDIFTVV
ncbi:1993_t:CDS:1 [Ambispora leptoticha]|uniref:1993_t:CDS:1 n=1 Tax=Ambispora leptoticha TaxID=144679 RepID=A0A9N8VZB2_9GLOM|nr:1993_t:CDS:1 [Ambispora leptoticha]